MESLAAQLRETIEKWAEDLRNTSDLGLLAKQGGLPPHALALYLESLRHLFEHSERNLTVAAARSDEIGHSALAAYFRRKAREEKGHDGWASSDLATLPRGVTQGLNPARGIVALTQLQTTLIERHPLCFVAYALWAEYFTVLIGDDWLDALAQSGYDRRQLSAIAKHLDADREHARASFSEIDSLWSGSPDLGVLLGVVDEAGQMFRAFCTEVCCEAKRAA